MRPLLFMHGVFFPELESCCPKNKGFGDKILLDLNLPVINWARRSDYAPGRSNRQPQAVPGQPKSIINRHTKDTLVELL
jgi:hypothetical protein